MIQMRPKIKKFTIIDPKCSNQENIFNDSSISIIEKADIINEFWCIVESDVSYDYPIIEKIYVI